MTILDYCGPLQMLESYEFKIINMLIEELHLKGNELFKFIEKIDIYRDVEYFYYDDKDGNVLGGFHAPSKNVIYLNLDGKKNETYTQRASNLIFMFPTIMHELCHYYQRKKLGLIVYGLCQLPIVRRATIEVSAYKISEYLFEETKKYAGMSTKDFAMLKKKYKFSKYEFDDFEKKLLIEAGEWDF
jgi:hypothetical protein